MHSVVSLQGFFKDSTGLDVSCKDSQRPCRSRWWGKVLNYAKKHRAHPALYLLGASGRVVTDLLTAELTIKKEAVLVAPLPHLSTKEPVVLMCRSLDELSECDGASRKRNRAVEKPEVMGRACPSYSKHKSVSIYSW